MVNYVSFNAAGSGEICPVCIDPLENGEVVVHEGAHEGSAVHLHPVHKKCIKVWLAIREDCPLCRAPVNPHSIRSPRERRIAVIKDIARSLVIRIPSRIILAASAGTSGLMVVGSLFRTEHYYWSET